MVLAAQQVSTPMWAWVFLALVVLVVLALMSLAMRRLGVVRTKQRSQRGLTSEQQAFQQEMMLLLQSRLQERIAAASAPADEGEIPASDAADAPRTPAEEPGVGSSAG